MVQRGLKDDRSGTRPAEAIVLSVDARPSADRQGGGSDAAGPPMPRQVSAVFGAAPGGVRGGAGRRDPRIGDGPAATARGKTCWGDRTAGRRRNQRLDNTTKRQRGKWQRRNIRRSGGKKRSRG